MPVLHFRCKERRRTMRVMLTVPLKVHGIDGERPFTVETKSHTVSLHGGSIELDMHVALGDILEFENKKNGERAVGKVVTIRRARDGKTYVAVEFVDPDVNFWHMAFPIPGAKPLRRIYREEKVAVLS
jgi:PilZ domain